MLEEAFVVVLAVCLGRTTVFLVLALLVLFNEGAQRGIRWLVGKSRLSGGPTEYQVTRSKPP